MKIRLNAIDNIFLISMLLITQASLPVKVIGILFLAFARPVTLIKKKVNTVQFFYLSMLVLTILYGLFYLNYKNYIIPYILVIAFWLSSYLVVTYILDFLKRNDKPKIDTTLRAYFIINAIASVYNYAKTAVQFGALNIYSITPAAGDHITGIFPNSSVNMIVCALFLVYFIQLRKYRYATVALLILLLTGFMSGILLLIVSVSATVFFYANFPLLQKLLFLFGIALTVLFFYLFSYSNVSYAFGYIDRILRMDDDVPFKIISFFQTFEFWLAGIKNFLVGAGPGNFSSRVAFTVSGEYVDWFPNQLEYISSVFRKNHLWIWTRDFGNIWDDRTGTANQPFSLYNQIIGEYGLVGLLLFLSFYIKYWFQQMKVLSYGKLLLPMMLSFFVLDYWFEYLNVLIIFEILIFRDLFYPNFLRQQKNDLVQIDNSI